jgi:hypothetical protein
VRTAARVVGILGAILASVAFAVPSSSAAAVGKDRILVVLVSYGPQPYARAVVSEAMTEANAFFRRSSFGKLTLVSTVSD